MTLLGPGDLDGPCLGGACPHDHSVERECWLCEAEFDSSGEELCERCEHLMGLDREDLVLKVVYLQGELDEARRGLR